MFPSHDPKWYRGLPSVVMVPPATPSWVADEDARVYEKSKLVTFITSNKECTSTQVARVKSAKTLIENNIDVVGKGFKDIDSKTNHLKDYFFAFAIENGNHDGYHTEKILDCFRTGTVPVYYGDSKIGKVFDENGIIRIEEGSLDVNEMLSSLSKELYEKMLPAIRHNQTSPTIDVLLIYHCSLDKFSTIMSMTSSAKY